MASESFYFTNPKCLKPQNKLCVHACVSERACVDARACVFTKMQIITWRRTRGWYDNMQ